MKMFRRNQGPRPRRMNVFGFAVLICLLAFSAGCVISPRRIVGGGTGGTGSPTPTPTPTSGAQGKLYVANPSTNSVVRFDSAAKANGNQAPAATISGSLTQLSFPQHIFVDAAADRLFVANQGGTSVLVFDAISTKTGNVAPARSISGASTGIILPTDLAVDSGKNLLYVADGRDILVFGAASTVSGNTAFTHDIQVGFVVAALFLDATNDRLFLADSAANAINIYDNASTLNSKVVPSRALTGAATQLSAPSGVAVDALNRLIVSNASSNSILVFVNAGAINANTPPSAVISGANTTLSGPAQIAVNRSTTLVELFVANPNGPNVPIFSNLGGTAGNIAPSRNISGAATTLALPGGITLDSTR
jgi:hypothetical protein